MASSGRPIPRRVVVVLFVVGAALLLLGASVLRSSWRALRVTLFEMPDWQEVSAVVTEAKLEESASRRPGTSPGPKTTDVYQPRIVYRYEFEGKEYTSDRWHLLEDWGEDRAAREAVVARYPVGQETTAYVNPDDPAEAVLEKEGIGAPVVMGGIGAFVSII